MAKRKGIIAKLLLVLAVLTLASFCFLGSTLARYTSSDSGSATVTVAKWSISFGDDDSNIEGTATATFDMLSPSMVEYNSDDSEGRTNSSSVVSVLTVTNNGDVDAKVIAATVTGITLYDSGGSEISVDDEVYDSDGAGIITQGIIEAIFSLTVYADDEGTNELSTDNAVTVSADGNNTADVYGKVTWTTYDSYFSDNSSITSVTINGTEYTSEDGTVGDYIDTWLGENVASVEFTVTFTAVQASPQLTTGND